MTESLATRTERLFYVVIHFIQNIISEYCTFTKNNKNPLMVGVLLLSSLQETGGLSPFSLSQTVISLFQLPLKHMDTFKALKLALMPHRSATNHNLGLKEGAAVILAVCI